MECKSGHHLAKGLLLLTRVLDGLHQDKGQHQEVQILVMWRPQEGQACGEVNRITTETSSRIKGIGDLKVMILVMVVSSLGVGSHHLAVEVDLRGLPLKGRECANSMKVGTARKGLRVIICTLKFWQI